MLRLNQEFWLICCIYLESIAMQFIASSFFFFLYLLLFGHCFLFLVLEYTAQEQLQEQGKQWLSEYCWESQNEFEIEKLQVETYPCRNYTYRISLVVVLSRYCICRSSKFKQKNKITIIPLATGSIAEQEINN